MFTGLVAGVAAVVSVTPRGAEIDLEVDLGDLSGGDPIGGSIALSGVCCTVTHREGTRHRFTLSPETLRRTWFSRVQVGELLNIEKPMRTGDLFGGHFVQGHVDGVAEVEGGVDPHAGGELWVRLPETLSRYCAVKGSIALDGVSLTIAALEQNRIMVAVIPHTAQLTTIGRRSPGDPLHVEVDVLAKYVERLLDSRREQA